MAAMQPSPVSLVGDAPRLAALLKPLRLRILAEARQPASATTIAAALGLSRQAVNYHVRALARAGFLHRAGRRRKRGLVEQKYIVSARAFVLAPDVLGPLSPQPATASDKFSAAYLMSLMGLVQKEVGRAWTDARGKTVPVLAMDSEIRFESAAERAAFAEALTEAVTRIIAEHTSPAVGRRYRLALGCYPIPSTP
jgi:DNA-binding transcriptional ArsR family regulator